VKNLDDQLSDERLREEFSAFGNVTSAHVMHDDKGLSRGFGFVCFQSGDEATRAVQEMNGKMVGNKPLYVSLAQRKDERRTFLEQQARSATGSRMAGRPEMAQQMGYPGAPFFYPQQMAPGVRGGQQPALPMYGMPQQMMLGPRPGLYPQQLAQYGAMQMARMPAGQASRQQGQQGQARMPGGQQGGRVHVADAIGVAGDADHLRQRIDEVAHQPHVADHAQMSRRVPEEAVEGQVEVPGLLIEAVEVPEIVDLDRLTAEIGEQGVDRTQAGVEDEVGGLDAAPADVPGGPEVERAGLLGCDQVCRDAALP